jgi:hypothetical protein
MRMIVKLHTGLLMLLLIYSLILGIEDYKDDIQRIFMTITAMYFLFVIKNDSKDNCHSYQGNKHGYCFVLSK